LDMTTFFPFDGTFQDIASRLIVRNQ
jgi:hypothetical protein